VMGSRLRLSAAIFGGLSAGLLALPLFCQRPTDQALASDRLPTPASVSRSDTLPMTAAEAAYFEVGFPPEDLTFTILLTDTARIEEARDILRGDLGDRVSVMGSIVKAPAFYNPRWSYHLDPASIEFFENAIEVCDAHPRYVAEHLDEVCGAFLPGCVWCPWSSVLVAEVERFAHFLPIVAG
jgi:hypothetical protein